MHTARLEPKKKIGYTVSSPSDVLGSLHYVSQRYRGRNRGKAFTEVEPEYGKHTLAAGERDGGQKKIRTTIGLDEINKNINLGTWVELSQNNTVEYLLHKQRNLLESPTVRPTHRTWEELHHWHVIRWDAIRTGRMQHAA
jgi:hypothetical protein